LGDSIEWSIVKDGKVVKEGVFLFKKKEATLVVPEVAAEPDFLSFARGWSFFGTSKCTNASTEQLVKQAVSEVDAVNKYKTYRAIADAEKARVIEGLLKRRMSKCLRLLWICMARFCFQKICLLVQER
jgi:aminopeptidase N